MNKYFTSFMLIIFLVGSCAPASPTPPPTATASPTVTPSPTPFVMPTSVPQTNEHLIVTRDFEHWAVLNADGSLQKYIQVPDIASPPGVSPDGNWLVYGLGSYENEP